MSNSLAIAAVTATLRGLLFQGLNSDLAGTLVTTHPPDRARATHSGNQLNLFLYQTQLNAAWRNADLPPVRPGEASSPPLPLVLHYLITAYGENDDELLSNRLLGRAMGVLHDHPLLGADEIRLALAGNDLHEQVERVRLTPQPLTLEELSKLWATFQTQYRVSAAYQASVVLIESTVPARTPLPVLQRGAAAVADTLPPFPTLERVLTPRDRPELPTGNGLKPPGFPEPRTGPPSALLGDELTLRGHHLDGANVVVRFSHARPATPLANPQLPVLRVTATEIDVGPASATASEIKAALPDLPPQAPAGLYTVAALISRPNEPDRPTNELPFSVAPRIAGPLPPVGRDPSGTATVTLTCSPPVLPAQRAALLLGERQIDAAPRTQPTTGLSFTIPEGRPGTYFVRLRVDGVDSLLVDRSVDPPIFDQGQRITIT